MIFEENEERKTRLSSVLSGLGLNYLDSLSFIKITESKKIKTACWAYNTITKEEKILINSAFMDKLTNNELLLVIKHEVMHREFYNGIIHEFKENNQLGNIAFDVVINYLLWKIDKEGMVQLSEKVYDSDTDDTPIALCNCTVDTTNILDPLLSKLHKDIWTGDKAPSPYKVYYNLMNYENIKVLLYLDPFSPNSDIDELEIDGEVYVLREHPDKRINISKTKKIFNKIMRDSKTFNTEENEIKNKFLLKPQKNNKSKEIETFLQTIRVNKKLSEITEKIKDELTRTYSLDPYPWYLSKLGFIYMLSGIYDYFPLYHNKGTSEYLPGHKKQISIYIDFSGSMLDLLPKISYIMQEIDNFPVNTYNSKTIYGFDTSIMEINIKDIQEGQFQGGGGTDFDTVINHFIDDPLDNDVILILTDGYSAISLSTIRKFRKSKKKLYSVYFGSNSSDKVLKEITEASICVSVNDGYPD